ncbi:MAG: collagen-like protein [Veillonella sp.]|nr:collagen-like protein [Veillonella sp.]
METNELILKLDKDSTLPLIEGLGKSAYAIAVAHGFRGTEQEWLDSLKGLQGPQGDPGPKGDPFRYEDFTAEQLEALKGPKGDKGEDGRDGASATADNAKALLLQGNVWCESASVDDVLTALISTVGKPFPRTDIKPLTFTQPTKGQTELSLQGENHYKVCLDSDSGEPVEIMNGIATITIPAFGKDDIVVDYFNMLGVKVSNITITGIKDLQFTDKNGITVFKEGNVLTVDLTNQTENIDKNYDISDRPAWVYDGVTEFKFISNSPNKIIGYAETSKIPIDNLYATLNTIGNPNISVIYYQYGKDYIESFVLITVNLYSSKIVNGSRQVKFLGRKNSRIKVDKLIKKKATYISNPMTEEFDGAIQTVGIFYNEVADNE